MKIQAINNTNFQGKFSNESKKNDGNWRMEYRPYSWEVNEHGDFKMAPQKELDLFAYGLPDNEKIYKQNLAYESCKDILGTEFYFADNRRKLVRKTITEMPAMNREESLRVRNEKLNKLLHMKESLRSKVQDNFEILKGDIVTSNNNYAENYRSYNLGYFDRPLKKSEHKNLFEEAQKNITKSALDLYEEAKKYAVLSGSIENIRTVKDSEQKEIALLEQARMNGSLIDISRRDIYDPNKALYDALTNNLKKAEGALIALPHRIISVREILKEIGSTTENIPLKAIHIVDEMIRKALFIKRI